MRQINLFIKFEYKNPVTTIADALQCRAKKHFCNLDCFEAYQCLQLVDEQSIQLRSFTFSDETFAYRRIAQDFKKTMVEYNSFVQEYADTLVKADRFAQYVDDIGIVLQTAEKSLRIFEHIIQRIERTSLKLLVNKCKFGQNETDF